MPQLCRDLVAYSWTDQPQDRPSGGGGQVGGHTATVSSPPPSLCSWWKPAGRTPGRWPRGPRSTSPPASSWSRPAGSSGQGPCSPTTSIGLPCGGEGSLAPIARITALKVAGGTSRRCPDASRYSASTPHAASCSLLGAPEPTWSSPSLAQLQGSSALSSPAAAAI